MPVNIPDKNKNNLATEDSISVSNGDAAASDVDETQFDNSLSRLQLAADDKDEHTFIRTAPIISITAARCRRERTG